MDIEKMRPMEDIIKHDIIDITELQKTKELIKANIKWENIYPSTQPGPGGGQCINIVRSRQRLYSEELDLTIDFGFHGSMIKNRDVIYKIFESLLDELIK